MTKLKGGSVSRLNISLLLNNNFPHIIRGINHLSYDKRGLFSETLIPRFGETSNSFVGSYFCGQSSFMCKKQDLCIRCVS